MILSNFKFKSSFQLLFSLVLISHLTNLNAQKDIYFEFGLGTASGMQTQRDINTKTTTNSSVTQDQTVVKYGLGQGICSKFVVGISTTQKINYTDGTKFVYAGTGYELELSHLLGVKTKIESSTNTNGALSNSYQKYGLNSLFMAPKFVFYTVRNGTKDNKKISLGIGPSIPFKANGNSFYYTKNSSGVVQERLVETNYRLNVGIAASLKFWKYGKSTYFFSEIFFRQNNLFAKTGLVTSYKVNGVEQISTMSISSKETEYSNTKNYNSANPVSANSPNQMLTYITPVSSLGFRVGFGILLQSRTDEEKERRKELKKKYKNEIKGISETEGNIEENTSKVNLNIDKAVFKSQMLVILNALNNRKLGDIVDYNAPLGFTKSWYKGSVPLTGFSNLQGQNMLGNYSYSASLDNSNSSDNKAYFNAMVELIDAALLGYTKEKSSYGDYYYYNRSDKNLYFKAEYNGTGSSVRITFSRS